jgi:hypothetical protein
MNGLARRVRRLESRVNTAKKPYVITIEMGPDEPNVVVEIPRGFLSHEERERYRWSKTAKPVPDTGPVPPSVQRVIPPGLQRPNDTPEAG